MGIGYLQQAMHPPKFTSGKVLQLLSTNRRYDVAKLQKIVVYLRKSETSIEFRYFGIMVLTLELPAGIYINSCVTAKDQQKARDLADRVAQAIMMKRMRSATLTRSPIK